MINTTGEPYGFYKYPWNNDECTCDICPCCGKRKRSFPQRPWIITCGSTPNIRSRSM